MMKSSGFLSKNQEDEKISEKGKGGEKISQDGGRKLLQLVALYIEQQKNSRGIGVMFIKKLV